MPKPVTPETIEAEISQDAKTGEWIATALGTSRLTMRAYTARSARAALTKSLEERIGKPIELVEKVKLPKALADQAASYKERYEQIKAAREELEEEFLPLVKALLAQKIQIQQVAALLGVSKQWLGQRLKQEMTGAYRDTPAKR